MITCYTVALVLKPARMVVNHYGVLVLCREGRRAQRRGRQRTWPEIRARRCLLDPPGWVGDVGWVLVAQFLEDPFTAASKATFATKG